MLEPADLDPLAHVQLDTVERLEPKGSGIALAVVETLRDPKAEVEDRMSFLILFSSASAPDELFGESSRSLGAAKRFGAGAARERRVPSSSGAGFSTEIRRPGNGQRANMEGGVRPPSFAILGPTSLQLLP